MDARLNLRLSTSVLMLSLCVSYLGSVPSAAHGQPISADEVRPNILWTDALSYVGKEVFVNGKVERIGHSKRIHFVNFDAKRRDAFTVIVYDSFMKDFPDTLENLYLNKLVRVRGMVTTYSGKPQVQITTPDQVQVIESLPVVTKPKDRPTFTRKDQITIATYNIRNLYDGDDDLYHNDDTTPAKPRDELKRVAKVIRELDADVLALQEVENRGYLQRFVDVFLPDMGYTNVVHFEGNDLRGSDVCLLSRIPVGAVTSYRHQRFSLPGGRTKAFSRDLLTVEILPPDSASFEVWVVHLKSNHDGRDYAEPIRVAEANAIRKIVDDRLKRDPSAAFVLCGDFNDTADSVTVETIIGQGARALRPTHDAIGKDQQITYNREPYLSMIDFMLCSPAMHGRYVEGSCKIRVSTLEESGSDHNPVMLRISSRKAAGGSAFRGQSR
jgi:endonuclease/exonuclease/phosphatase family metal-dependent hydrolase